MFLLLRPLRRLSSSSSRWTTRTHTCGELRAEHEGAAVHVSGWIQAKRMDRFVVLRDAHGTTQCVIDDKDMWDRWIKRAGLESVVSVEGVVRARPDGAENENMETGFIEVEVSKLEAVYKATDDIPMLPAGRDFNRAKEEFRLKHRDNIRQKLTSLNFKFQASLS
jgi:aspartyl-tRNA synthetase